MMVDVILGTVFLILVVICYKLIFKLTTGICTSSVCLVGKTAIVTGGNTGCGLETALDLAKRGAKVILACRNETKAKEAVRKIKEETNNDQVTYKILNLASFKSVRQFVADVNATEERLDILVNNAGAAALPDDLTEDGLPPVMQINYLAPFLLTNLLLDLLKKNPSRIVNVSSFLALLRCINFDELVKSSGTINQYTISKLCQIIFTVELARRLAGTTVTTYSVHPGVAYTEVYRNLPHWIKRIALLYISIFLKNRFEGAQTQIYCSVANDLEIHNGQHFHDCQVVRRYWNARNHKIANRLWRESEKIVSLNM